ncbi:MAG: DUF5615 family PIN-like protein [Bryobacterales bacterium]
MKIKLDENLPEGLVTRLQALGHDVDTVRIEGLAGRHDSDVWRGAQVAKRFLITQDLDFSDARLYQPGTHQGVLLVRLAHPGRESLLTRVEDLFLTERVTEWTGCLVVATDNKVRIKRPE